MKQFFVSLVIALLWVSAAVNSHAAPSPPRMSYVVNGLNITVSWTSVPAATGYTLYYAPYPFTGPETIGSIEMGRNTSLNVTLWDGAAYYIAVTAHSAEGESEYSNIEQFITVCPKIDVVVTGLDGSVELANSADTLNIVEDGTYTLSRNLTTGTMYSVEVVSQSADQTCSVVNHKGIIGTSDVVNIFVNCIRLTDQSSPLSVEDANSKLTTVGDNELFFSSLPDSLQGISVGDVIYSAESESAPDGLLRKVVSVRTVFGQVMLRTEDAVLTDLIDNGGFSYKGRIREGIVDPVTRTKVLGTHAVLRAVRGAEDYCGNRPTDFVIDFTDQPISRDLSISGCLGLNIDLDLIVDIGLGHIERFRFVTKNDVVSALEITVVEAINSGNLSVDYQFPNLFKIPVMSLSGLPITLQGNLAFSLDGDGAAGVSVGLGANVTADIGVDIHDGETEVITAADFDMEAIGPEVTASVEVKAGLGPQCSLMIADTIGPQLSLIPYLELSADISSNPWWVLKHGGDFSLDINISLNQIPGLGWLSDRYNLNYGLWRRPLWGPFVLKTANGGSARQLTGLTITGGHLVDENGTLQLTANALWNDGTTSDVTASAIWSNSSGAVTSVAGGLLAAGQVIADTSATISARYTANGVMKSAMYVVTVKNVTLCIDADDDNYCGIADCNDNSSAINPGAVEICGDGIDQNCSGADLACGGTGLPTDGVVAYYPFDGDVLDDSGNSLNGTIVGSAVNLAAQDRFNGANKAVYIGNSAASYIKVLYNQKLDIQRYTVSAWVKKDLSGTSTGGVLCYGDNNVEHYGLVANNERVSHTNNYVLGQESLGNYQQYATSILQDRQWHHVAITYDGSKKSIWLDGSKVNEVDYTGTIDYTTKENLTIGNDRPGGDEPFVGSIDELRIYNRALSSSEISMLAQ